MTDEVKNYLDRIKQQSFFGEESVSGSLKYNIKWYRDKAAVSYRCFRGVGFAAIFLSITLPFVSVIWQKNAIPVGVISWLIALAGGANGFFQWGRTWQSRTEAYIRLERLIMEWEIAVHNPSAKINEIAGATKKLVSEARETIKNETGAFFEEVQFPEVEAPTRKDP